MGLTKEGEILKKALGDKTKGLSLAIATATYMSLEFSPYVNCLMPTQRLLWEIGIECDRVNLSGDSYVDRAKNILLTMIHKDRRYSHLLFIDSDQTWEPQGILGHAAVR